MKVLLIPPIAGYKSGHPQLLSLSDFPSGFAYIAAALEEAGHEVFGLNLNNRSDYADGLSLVQVKVPLAIQKVKPDLIGVGGICTDYAFLRDVIKVIRGACNVPIVLGGGIVSNDESVYEILKPDYAVIGEGEDIIYRIIKELESGIKDFGIRKRNPEHYRPIDKLPFPDYEPFGIKDMMDNFSMATRLLYRYSRENPRPYNIVTARSCPMNCTFCQHSRGIPYRARSMDNIFAEIREAYDKYHFNILIMLDELFVANKARMNEFCETLIAKKKEYGWDFDWMFQTHANAHLDKESLTLAKQAGCVFFSYRLESASQPILDSMNKHSKVEQGIEASRLAHEAKIGFGGNLIFGDPAETEETICESLAVWYQHYRADMVFLGHISPYPGSAVFDYCVEKGLVPKDRREYYEHIDEQPVNMTSMSNATFQSWLLLIRGMETAWLQVKETKGIATEDTEATEKTFLQRTGTKMWKITAVCPYCGETVKYRQPLQISKSFWIGCGCTNCQKRIRIVAP